MGMNHARLTCGLAAITLLAGAFARPAARAEITLTVQADKPGHAISPTLYGLFFEEINQSGDGGLYAEMVRNRSFEYATALDPWTLVKTGSAEGTIALETVRGTDSFSRTALRISACNLNGGSVGAANPGYWGMAVRQGASYDATILARCGGGYQGPLTVRLESSSGALLAEAKTDTLTTTWKAHPVTLTSNGTDAAARLVVLATEPGTVWLDMVSLFPKETYKGRTNGLRSDLAGMLSTMKPSFVRFPGGCWVEGETMATSQRWKQTIGPIESRRTQYNLWQYQSTNGLGFHEYLQMCEDLGAEPLFVINVGMSHRETVPLDQMDEYVQDALDAIEYANGPTTSRYGAMRAANGHPAPFHLSMMEIGNENGGAAYRERWPLFYRAIKAKYPEMKLVADVWGGGYPTDPMPDLIDEHYYSSPGFFLQNAAKYDSYDRSGPKVYVGEYAVTEGSGAGNLAAAIGEAAFMTGMERNSDIVAMSSYAPLFANVNYKRWNPDLINFDSSRVYGTPSYYVQQLFSANKGDTVLPVAITGATSAPPAALASGAVGVGTWATQAEFADVKVTNASGVLYQSNFAGGLDGWTTGNGTWAVQDGALRQSSSATDCRATVGDPSWTDYTLTLRARKISGSEGFLIMVRVKDTNNFLWWNIGGWNNTVHAIERCLAGGKVTLAGSTPGSVVAGRWYDIQVAVTGGRIRCTLDGVLIHDTSFAEAESLYASASRETATGDIILKVVNPAAAPAAVQMNVQGSGALAPEAAALVLTGAPADENTLDAPTKVAPAPVTVTGVAPSFAHTFPASSVTVLRLKPQG